MAVDPGRKIPSQTVIPACIRCIHRGSTTIRLDEGVYERLKAEKRPNETFSEAVERLLERESLLDLVGLWSPGDVEGIRRVITDANEDAEVDIEDVIERIEQG